MKLLIAVGIWASVAAVRAQDLAPDSITNSLLETRSVSSPTAFFTSSALYAADGVVYLVSAVGDPITRLGTYSWRKTGMNTGTLESRRHGVSGALQEFLTFTSANNGTFRLSGNDGVFTIRPFLLTANAPLRNVSSRVSLVPNQPSLTGFVVAGNAPRRVLVRAIGPSLAAFGVGNVATTPVLAVFRGGISLATNSGWSGATNLAAAFSATGAFALPAASRDCAVTLALEPGAYTAQVRDPAGGDVLVEIYFID